MNNQNEPPALNALAYSPTLETSLIEAVEVLLGGKPKLMNQIEKTPTLQKTVSGIVDFKIEAHEATWILTLTPENIKNITSKVLGDIQGSTETENLDWAAEILNYSEHNAKQSLKNLGKSNEFGLPRMASPDELNELRSSNSNRITLQLDSEFGIFWMEIIESNSAGRKMNVSI